MLPREGVMKMGTQQISESASIVRWMFTRGSRALACEVRIDEYGAFDVCVVPFWDVKSTVIEGYGRAASALQRHAEIAAAFRQTGWVLARERTGGRAEVAV
jgi:hypothetical protein